ncbi:MAG TPA: pitrilysin family protein [Terriglobia bacterium]|nr:pitrilysin family protein [Terriglobia bacterium]
MKKSVLLVVFAVLLGSSCSSRNTATETVIPQIPVEKHTLANGLDVLLVEDSRLPQVAVDIWYHVGPVNEDKGRTGFAHLFEHMMFQKSKHIPEDSFFRFLEAAGASSVNGSTAPDRTNYYETVPSNQLELALWLESDRMGYLLDDLTEASFRNQQDVVRNERRENFENRPYGPVEEAIAHLMYPSDHPYYANVIGSHADIQAAELKDVKNFFKQYYAPNNASLAIVGDFKKAEALALVEKYFGSLKRGPDVPPVKVTTPPITEERRTVVKDRIELPRLYMAWIVPPIYTDGDALADISADILGGDKVSRLYESLVYEKQIAQDVAVYNYSYTLGSTFTIQATAAPNHTLEEIEKEIDAQLETFRKTPPSDAELSGTQRSIERNTLFSLESSGGVADRINAYNHHKKDPAFLQQDIDRYRKATPEAVRDFAAQYLTKNSRVVVYGMPGEPDFGPAVPASPPSKSREGGEAVNPDEAWRAKPPVPGPSPDLAFPSLVSFKLSNGLDVILDSRKGLPIVAANLVIRSGIATNPVGKPGLAAFMLDMLDEGTTTRSALGFAEQLKQAGVTIGEAPGRDYSGLVMTSTRGTLAAGIDLLADAILNPAFDPKEIERVKMRRLGELVQMKSDPGQVSDILTILSLNGKDNPYGYVGLGTEASVKSITGDDLKKFWQEQARPGNSALVVSGDVTQDDLKPLLETALGKWTGPAAPPVSLPEPAPTRRIVLVDLPGSPQTQVRIVIPGPRRNSPDYESLLVMNEIMGGTFSSRINMNIREKNGYAYGASSWIRTLAYGGWIAAGAGVRTEATAPAVREMIKEMSSMAALPVKPEEIQGAKSSLVRAFPSWFETTGQTVNILAEIPVYNLGLNYYPEYAKKVEAVNDAQIRDVAKKYLLPEKMIVVAVGDRKVIEGGLKSAGIGPVELRDPEGNPR